MFKTFAMITVYMAQKESQRKWRLCNREEVIDTYIWKLRYNAVECRHVDSRGIVGSRACSKHEK